MYYHKVAHLKTILYHNLLVIVALVLVSTRIELDHHANNWFKSELHQAIISTDKSKKKPLCIFTIENKYEKYGKKMF